MDDAAKDRWIAGQILPHEPQVRAWLLRHVRTLSAADADDLIQEAYARLWSSDIPAVENSRAYFFTVVRNLVFEQARRARIVPMERMGEIEALRIISEAPGPEQCASAREELESLKRVLAELPPQCRRTFELRKIEGLSIRQTAERMGLSESTVEKQLSKALARILAAFGKTESSATEPMARPHGNESTGQD